MSFFRVIAVPVLALLAGCVPSVHALYGGDDLVQPEGLVGTFVGPEDEMLVFAEPGADGLYRLAIVNVTDEAAVMRAGLTEIDGALYLDMIPALPAGMGNDEIMAVHVGLFHSFYRVTLEEDALSILEPNLAWLNRHLGANPEALDHYFSDALHLTAETPELRAFVAEHPDLFSGEPRIYRRLP